MTNHRKGADSASYKHGECATRLYKVWCDMKARCLTKTDNHYKWYGARGISVCKEWLEYIPFSKWAKAHGYSDDLTLDRIDNDGNYEPTNCRFVDMSTQCVNRRDRKSILGIRNIYPFRGGFRVQIRRHKKTIANKLCHTLEEAIEFKKEMIEQMGE